MQKIGILLLGLVISLGSFAQQIDHNGENTAERMINENSSKVQIGGYGQIDYNQPLTKDVHDNGTLDVHRLVMLFGYHFSSKTSFVTELEFEHVKEVYVEQAFINHRFNQYFNLKAGLILVPMGIINEYHEPTTFNGVERPNLDKNIVPTTWREIGAGFTGRIDEISLKYQAYVMNGFNGYAEGTGKFRSKDALRKGRQKGAESFMSSPSLSAKVDWYGLKGLRVGLSGYSGKSQSDLFDGLDMNDNAAMTQADSSVVGVNMVGLDARYQIKGFQFRGQYILANISNTDQYNTLTGKDMGSQIGGYYAEIGYNVLNSFETEYEFTPFVRYEKYNTQMAMAGDAVANDVNNKSEIVVGFGWKLAKGAVLKADYQLTKTAASDDYTKQINFGVGIWF
ncbi:MAG: hypothetical protein JEZ03_01045 [Bacteroidales bacterium]|nr:hypothetical protein [Bacteroidales bacterium]